MLDAFTSFAAGVVLGVVVVVFSLMGRVTEFKTNAIEYGCAEHNAKTGEFTWITPKNT